MREGESGEIGADISSLLHRGWRPLYSLGKGIRAIVK